MLPKCAKFLNLGSDESLAVSRPGYDSQIRSVVAMLAARSDRPESPYSWLEILLFTDCLGYAAFEKDSFAR